MVRAIVDRESLVNWVYGRGWSLPIVENLAEDNVIETFVAVALGFVGYVQADCTQQIPQGIENFSLIIR